MQRSGQMRSCSISRCQFLDAHQVLARLKQDEGLCDIPVVFLTGRTGTDEMVAGLREGAHSSSCKRLTRSAPLILANTSDRSNGFLR